MSWIGHPDPVRRLAHAAFHNVVDAKFARDLSRFYRLALVRENGIARNDQKLTEARQLRNDVFRQSVGKEFLFRIAAHVGEGEHSDRRLARSRRGRWPG